MITPTEKKCCEECDGTIRDENNFGRDYGCLLEDQCECHTPTTPSSTWEENIRGEITAIIEAPMRSTFSTSDIRIGAWSSTQLNEKVHDITELIRKAVSQALTEGYEEGQNSAITEGTLEDQTYWYEKGKAEGERIGREKEREEIRKVLVNIVATKMSYLNTDAKEAITSLLANLQSARSSE